MEPATKRSRLMQRADAHMDQKEFYEAFMLFKGQLARGSAETAIAGVQRLLGAEQGKLAGELAAEAVAKHGLAAVSGVSLSSASSKARAEYLVEVLRRVDTAAEEHPRLQAELADALIAEKSFAKAQEHAVLSGEPGVCLRLLTAWVAGAPAAERPLFHLRLYLLLLIKGAHAGAGQVAASAAQDTPLAFIGFLHRAVAAGDKALFDRVAQHSKVAALLRCDSFFGAALEKVAVAYFSGGKFAGKVAPVPAAAPKPAPTPAPKPSVAPVTRAPAPAPAASALTDPDLD
eukprot:TRINITY_DN8810_c0_g1_i1.p1 TRINITY_DN8810_c0_g1~~TRINITY_DN8810_c0_g1_i1.p1  ORF type:complete len:288 (+),score=107.99 TRINITY_DN8810_c0_g1_i1:68-931(+)